MSAAKRINVVVVPNYVDARRRAYARTKPVQPTAAQVNAARCQLFEHALADGLKRVFDIAETLDQLELEVSKKMDRFGALLERYRGQVRRRR